MIIRKLNKSEINKLVDLHYEVLPSEFLTSISKNFLKEFYHILYNSKKVVFLAMFEEDEIIGGIVGIEDDYKETILSNLKYIYIFMKNLPGILMKPGNLSRLFSSFLFKLKEKQKTEIFFIGVKNKWQGRKIGKSLIESLTDYWKEKHRRIFVNCKNKLPSNNFYLSSGFKLNKTFSLYGEKWNRYEKNF